MTEKGSVNRATTVGQQTPDNTDSATSDPATNTPGPASGQSGSSFPPSPSADSGQAARAARAELYQARLRRRTLTLRLQTIGLIAALMAIPLAYWQGRLQSSHGRFERNQRVVELSLGLANFWEAQFDRETRYRLGRVIAKFNSLKTDEERKTLARALADDNNLIDADAASRHEALYSLIQPDLSGGNPEGSKTTPDMAVAKYRSALIRALNTMEVIAVVKAHTKENQESQRVIDSAYTGAIQQRYKQLLPFIDEYRARTNAGRATPAWEPLSKMVAEEDAKLNRVAAAARP